MCPTLWLWQNQLLIGTWNGADYEGFRNSKYYLLNCDGTNPQEFSLIETKDLVLRPYEDAMISIPCGKDVEAPCFSIYDSDGTCIAQIKDTQYSFVGYTKTSFFFLDTAGNYYAMDAADVMSGNTALRKVISATDSDGNYYDFMGLGN